MLKYRWNLTHIATNQQANNMVKLFKEDPPSVCAFDTETTGLHIILDKPFLFKFGWISDKLNISRTKKDIFTYSSIKKC